MNAPASQAASAKDPVAELAQKIYVGMASRVYGNAGNPERAALPPPELARLSFSLAEAFYAEDREFNPVTLAAAAAAKVPTRFDAADLDLGSLHQRR